VFVAYDMWLLGHIAGRVFGPTNKMGFSVGSDSFRDIPVDASLHVRYLEDRVYREAECECGGLIGT
jgi:hypothetical protein